MFILENMEDVAQKKSSINITVEIYSVLALKLSLVKYPRKYSNTLWLYISRYDFVTYCFWNEVFPVIKAIKCMNLSYKKDFDYIYVFMRT